MKRCFTYSIMIALLFAATNFAGYIGAGKVTLIRIEQNGLCLFSVSNPYTYSTELCNWWGYYFKFDSSTSAGKNLLAALIFADANDRDIDVQYINSSTPGVGSNDGCTINTMAVATSIIVR